MRKESQESDAGRIRTLLREGTRRDGLVPTFFYRQHLEPVLAWHSRDHFVVRFDGRGFGLSDRKVSHFPTVVVA